MIFKRIIRQEIPEKIKCTSIQSATTFSFSSLSEINVGLEASPIMFTYSWPIYVYRRFCFVKYCLIREQRQKIS